MVLKIKYHIYENIIPIIFMYGIKDKISLKKI